MTKTLIAAILALALLGACRRGGAPSAPLAPHATAEGALRLPGFPSRDYWTRVGPTAALPLVSAHRGRPELPSYPENALESIERLHEAGDFIAELDVQRSSDGVLFLFHDWDLDRLTVHAGDPGERTWADLDTMRLRDATGALSPYTIPSLDEVLAFAKGRLLLSLDRKGAATYDDLAAAAAARDMSDEVSLILYDAEDYLAYRALDRCPPMNQGVDTLPQVRAMAAVCGEVFGDAPCPINLFLGVGTLNRAVADAAAAAQLRTILGTFGELDAAARDDGGATYRRLASKGVTVVATNLPLLAARALYGPVDSSDRVEGFGVRRSAPGENTPAPR